jgi:hypothetical protein
MGEEETMYDKIVRKTGIRILRPQDAAICDALVGSVVFVSNQSAQVIRSNPSKLIGINEGSDYPYVTDGGSCGYIFPLSFELIQEGLL